jgi:predicted RNase H-like HicB family nuclease
MAHYIAFIEDLEGIEDVGGDHGVGVWFPDLPGCNAAGNDIDEALRDAPEAIERYIKCFDADRWQLPSPRTLSELKTDPKYADDIKTHMVALIEFPARARAAE